MTPRETVSTCSDN